MKRRGVYDGASHRPGSCANAQLSQQSVHCGHRRAPNVSSCLKRGPYPPNSIAPPTAQSSPASCEVSAEAGWAPTKTRACAGPGWQQPEASRTAPRRGTQCHPPLTTATHVPVHRHRRAHSHTYTHSFTHIFTHV